MYAIWLTRWRQSLELEPVLVQDGLELYKARTLARRLNSSKTTDKVHFIVWMSDASPSIPDQG